MQTWNNSSKADLPPGPWMEEPDKAHWVDKATGLDCLIVRAGSLGHLCGYVGVPPEHPWHGYGYDRVPADAHGGLTFADACGHGEDEAAGICHVPAPGRPDNVWWLGFDCAHYRDLSPGMYVGQLSVPEQYRMPDVMQGEYRTFDWVKAEVEQLAAQCATPGELRPEDTY